MPPRRKQHDNNASKPPPVTQIEQQDVDQPLAASLRDEDDASLMYNDAGADAIPTDLTVPDHIVRVAERPGEVSDPSYAPAKSSLELETVGGLEDWFEDDAHWGASKDYIGFAPRRKVDDPATLTVLTRRAVVEALALREGDGRGPDPSEGDTAQSMTAAWSRGGRAEMMAALAVGVQAGEDGAGVLTGDVAGLRAGLQERPAESAADEYDAAELMPEEARELAETWDGSWQNISLQDPVLKFAITKRILQLTGRLLCDSKQAQMGTVGDLLSELIKPPPPKKLAEEIVLAKQLLELPNVSVYNRRVTPLDKEQMVGRWKVIVRELEKRQLPVTGTGGYGKMVERRWATGKT